MSHPHRKACVPSGVELTLWVITLMFIPSKRLSVLPREQGNLLLTEVNKLTDLITQEVVLAKILMHF